MRKTSTRYRSPHLEAGVTLLELMLVITVAAVILGIAIPNFRSFMLNSRMTSASNDLLAAIHLARTEAIKRSTQTVLCFSASPEEDEPACDGDGTQGWVVFVDDNENDTNDASDGNFQADASEAVILRHVALPETITPRSFPAGNAGYLAFNRSGFTVVLDDDFTSVVLCDGRNNQAIDGGDMSAARAVVVSPTGRPSVTRSVDAIEDLGGC